MNHLASPGAGRGTDSHCYAACEGNRDPALVGRCTPAHTLADPRPLVANSIAIMGAVIGRSSVAGIIAGIVWFLIDALLGGLLPPASLSNSIEVLGAQLTHLVMDPNGSITTVNPSGSLTGLLGIVPMLVLALYLVVPMAVAAFLFRRRDMLGVG